MSSFRRDEAMLWVLLGVAGIASFYQARRILYEFREVTIVTTEEKGQDVIGQHTEDAISTETLGDLYNGPDYHIRDAALKILLERAVRSENIDTIFECAKSSNEEQREKGMAILAYMVQSKVQKAVFSPKLCTLVVQNLLASYRSRRRSVEADYRDDWKVRPRIERHALKIVRTTLESSSTSVKDWLDAGLISTWARYYIFWITRDRRSSENPEQTHKLVDKIMDGDSDDQDLAAILVTLCNYPEARSQLKTCRIVSADSRYIKAWATYSETLRESTFDLSTESFELPLFQAAEPANENEGTSDDDEQVALRRRRREAIVIGDVGQPISQDNIYNAADADTVEEFEGFRRVT